MPYVPRIRYIDLPFSTPMTSFFTVDDSAVDKPLGAITLPSNIVGDIIGIYTEFYIGKIEQTTDDQDWADGDQYIALDVDSGGYDNIVLISASSLNMKALELRLGGRNMGSFILNSALTKPIAWGSTLTLKWALALFNWGSTIFDCQVTVHLLVRM